MDKELMQHRTFTASFTDMHGVAHTDAVCVLTSARQEINVLTNPHSGEENRRATVTYSIGYWPDEMSREAGFMEYAYQDQNGCGSVTFDHEYTDDAAMQAACVEHFKTVEIPRMDAFMTAKKELLTNGAKPMPA